MGVMVKKKKQTNNKEQGNVRTKMESQIKLIANGW